MHLSSQANCRLFATAFEAGGFDVNWHRVNHEVTGTLRRIVDNAGTMRGIVMYTEPRGGEENE